MLSSAFLVSALLLLSPGALPAQTDSSNLADQARSLPPEFAADLLFRLIDAGRITSADTERELLETIAGLAAAVPAPVRMDDVVGWTDTDAWAGSRAAALQLDALSLRCRVVKHMLPLDPQRARQLFLDIVLPAPEPVKCDAALVWNPSIYYETARELADRQLITLDAPLRAIASPAQLSPAVRAVRLLHCSSEQRRFLIDLLTSRLTELTGSPRESGRALGSLPTELAQLGEDARQQGLTVDALVAAYRKFLVRAASGEQCADGKMAAAVDSFNDRLRWGGYLARADLPRIAPEEAKPASLGSRAHVDRYWRTDQAKRLLSAIRHLRFGEGSKPLSAAQMSAETWQTEAGTLLTSLEAWKDDGESSPATSFHERATLYSSLLQLLPPGPLHDAAAQSAITFLADSNMKGSAAPEWLLELTNLMALKQPEIAKAMQGSKDPVISLYAAVL